MKAVLATPDLIDVERDDPIPGPHDLVLRVEALAVNPVDTKVRAGIQAGGEGRLLGWDAAGVVEACGAAVTRFRPGDAVMVAGDIRRPGCYAQRLAVDARLCGRKPDGLSWAEAACLPLTGLTAWEGMFEGLGFDPEGADAGRSLLILGGAGGVGSIAIQLARRAGLTVIASASRPESQAWVRGLGADHVVDHHKPLAEQLHSLGLEAVDAIANFTDTDRYWQPMGELVQPHGSLLLIVGNRQPLPMDLPKQKSLRLCWEFMFSRSATGGDAQLAQGLILDRLAGLVEAGEIRTTLSDTLEPISAATLEQAHERLRSGRTIGKIALQGWG
ncbi:MAG: zinc-binding alcohol dehydrogenase family protein [Synechococcus sp. ELA057]